MSFYSAFPTSPLSRSALASEGPVDGNLALRSQSTRSKAHGQLSSPLASSAAPRRLCNALSPDAGHFGSMLPSPPGPSGAGYSANSSSLRHVSGPARLMCNPFSSPWSPSSTTSFDHGYDGDAVSPPLPSSSFTRSVNTRRRSSGFSVNASSSTPNFGSLVGSFQESLLRGRMSMPASKPLVFDAEIGVLGMGRCKPSLRCPPHVHIKFPAHFYDFHASDNPISVPSAGSTAALGSPYVGTIDLESHYHNMLLAHRMEALSTARISPADQGDLPAFPGYAVPPKGQIQLIVKYPDLNAVKLFLVPYDLTDMQPGTKTFVRQKTVARPGSSGNDASANPNDGAHLSNPNLPNNAVRATPNKEALRFAIHLQFCCPPAKSHHDDNQAGFDGSESRRFRHRDQEGQSAAKKSGGGGRAARSPKIFLHKTIRLVFGARALDSSEKLVDQIETPGQGAQRFSTYNGPDEEWHELLREVKAARFSTDQFRPTSLADSSTSSLESGSQAVAPSRTGLGIAIQSIPTRAPRHDADGERMHDSLTPLNSDPNGERWQPSSSFVNTSTIAPSMSTAAPLPSTSAWSLSSHGSSVGTPTQRWPRYTHPEQQDIHQLARSLASSRLTEALTSQPKAVHSTGDLATQMAVVTAAADGTAAPVADDVEPTAAQHHRAAMSPSVRPSRIRSASTASLSEARVESVSALGRLEEAAETTDAQGNSLSADSPFSRRTLRLSRTMADDRPSLIRKLSEQFARAHTPSPKASPKLGPATPRGRADDGLTELAIDDPDGADGGCDSTFTASRPHSTRSIR